MIVPTNAVSNERGPPQPGCQQLILTRIPAMTKIQTAILTPRTSWPPSKKKGGTKTPRTKTTSRIQRKRQVGDTSSPRNKKRKSHSTSPHQHPSNSGAASSSVQPHIDSDNHVDYEEVTFVAVLPPRNRFRTRQSKSFLMANSSLDSPMNPPARSSPNQNTPTLTTPTVTENNPSNYARTEETAPSPSDTQGRADKTPVLRADASIRPLLRSVHNDVQHTPYHNQHADTNPPTANISLLSSSSPPAPIHNGEPQHG